jgi:hypothetical protein
VLLPSCWMMHHWLDERGAAAAASGPAAASAFAPAMAAPSDMDRAIRDRPRGLDREMERCLKDFIRDMVRIVVRFATTALGPMMSAMGYALFRFNSRRGGTIAKR